MGTSLTRIVNDSFVLKFILIFYVIIIAIYKYLKMMADMKANITTIKSAKSGVFQQG